MTDPRLTRNQDVDSPVSRLASAPTTGRRAKAARAGRSHSASGAGSSSPRRRIFAIAGFVGAATLLVGAVFVIVEAITHPLQSNGTNDLAGGGGQLNKQTTEVGGIVNSQAVQGAGGVAGGGGVSGSSHSGPHLSWSADNPQDVSASVINQSGSLVEVAYLGSFANMTLTGEALLTYGGKLNRGDTVEFTMLSSKLAQAFGAGHSTIGDLGEVSSIIVIAK